jgi:predicted nucleic acid-binding protein
VIVIGDTSVILNLCCVQQQNLLQILFTRILVPPDVRLEFHRAAAVYPRFHGLVLPTWTKAQAPQTIPEDLRRNPHLDSGEIAALALALEIDADAVLIDETEGRRAARRLGVTAIGVAGILVRARQSDLLPAIAPVFKQLEEDANFWLAPEIRAEALRIVGEVS